MDFPRPDPVRGLAPHLILLDDGRGVNLGRILGQPVPGTETRLEGPRQPLGQEDGDGEAVPAARPGP